MGQVIYVVLNVMVREKLEHPITIILNWGYGGSGPAQLALALLLHITDEQEAVTYHQKFKWDFVANLPQDDFDEEINLKEWLETVKGVNNVL